MRSGLGTPGDHRDRPAWAHLFREKSETDPPPSDRCWPQGIMPTPSKQDLLRRGHPWLLGLRPPRASQLWLWSYWTQASCSWDPATLLHGVPAWVCVPVQAGNSEGTAMHLPGAWKCQQRAKGVSVMLLLLVGTASLWCPPGGWGTSQALVVWSCKLVFLGCRAIS